MIYTLHAPATLSGEIALPPSKSISNRALIIRALSQLPSSLENLSNCDDTQVMVRVLTGKDIHKNVQASGTSMRFLTAYYSTLEGETILDGTERMRQRPIGPLVNALRECGAQIDFLGVEGFPPLRIKGRALEGGCITMRGDISSQFVSALLMIGPATKHGLSLKLKGKITSQPYIDLTIQMMRAFGAKVERSEKFHSIRVFPGIYGQNNMEVENDWSAVSYWYELVTLMGGTQPTLHFDNFFEESIQGDARLKDIFRHFGVKTTFKQQPFRHQQMHIEVRKKKPKLLKLDFSDIPDLAQTLVCTCLGTSTRFHFSGLETLYIKETDRVAALISEARKIGFVLTSPSYGELKWDGQRCEPTHEPIDTHQDHRMAMAFAPLAVIVPGLRISNPEVVNKSYPDFWDHLRQVGFTIKETP